MNYLTVPRVLESAAGEHRLHALVHNILKIFTADVELAPTPA